MAESLSLPLHNQTSSSSSSLYRNKTKETKPKAKTWCQLIFTAHIYSALTLTLTLKLSKPWSIQRCGSDAGCGCVLRQYYRFRFRDRWFSEPSGSTPRGRGWQLHPCDEIHTPPLPPWEAWWREGGLGKPQELQTSAALLPSAQP